MKNKNKKYKHGMVALFPAVIISGILIILCVTASRSFLSFLYRTTLYDEKIQANVIAHACSLRVLAKRVQDSSYAGGESLSVDGTLCVVGYFPTTTTTVSVKIDQSVGSENVIYK